MHVPKVLLRWGSATLFLASGLGRAARAETAAVPVEALAPPSHDAGPLSPQEEMLLKRFDKNGDGRLEPNEIAAAQGMIQQQMFSREALARKLYDQLLARYGAAKTGKLTDEQQVEALAFLKAKNPRAYAALTRPFAARDEGELNSNQRAALFQYLSNLPADLDNGGRGAADEAGLGPRPAARLYDALLERFDVERKGSLSPAEQAQALRFLAQSRPGVYRRLVERFDRAGNGYLDPVESAAMFDTLAQLRAADGPRNLRKP